MSKTFGLALIASFLLLSCKSDSQGVNWLIGVLAQDRIATRQDYMRAYGSGRELELTVFDALCGGTKSSHQICAEYKRREGSEDQPSLFLFWLKRQFAKGAKFQETGRVIVPEKVVIEGVQYEPGYLQVTGSLDSKTIEVVSFTKKEDAKRFGEAYISKINGVSVGSVLDSQHKEIQPDKFLDLFSQH